MKTTCVLFVLGTIAAMLGYYVAIQHYLPEVETTPHVLLSVFGGISILLLIGAISNVIQGVSDKRVIADALKNAPMQDQKPAAAIGTISPLGLSTVHAPF